MIFPGQLVIRDSSGGSVALDPGTCLTVGREGDFPVGVGDEYVHRLLLGFWDNAGAWMVTNLGRRITVKVGRLEAGVVGVSRLAPGMTLPVPTGVSELSFATTVAEYRLEVTGAMRANPPAWSGPSSSSRVTSWSFIVNEEQSELLKVLTGPLIEHPGSEDSAIPTVREVAAMLGWTQKKVNSKIDNMCRALERNGVAVVSPRIGYGPSSRVALARFAAETRSLSDPAISPVVR